MSDNLKVMDAEFALAGQQLVAHGSELENILVEYQSTMNRVNVAGLHSAKIGAGVRSVLAKLTPVGEDLQKGQADLFVQANQFVERIDALDRY